MRPAANVALAVIVHVGAWLLGFVAMLLLSRHSESRYVYSLMTGWWLALYAGYVLRVDARTAIPCLLVYVALATVGLLTGFPPLFHDAPSWSAVISNAGIAIDFLVVSAIQGLAFISPILLNGAVRAIWAAKGQRP